MEFARGRRALYVLGLVVVACLAIGAWWSGWTAERLVSAVGSAWGGVRVATDWLYNSLDKSARFLAPIVTIAVGSYGIYHKLNFTKSRMHVHIERFLKRDDERLAETGSKFTLAPGAEGLPFSPIVTVTSVWGTASMRR